MDPSPSQGSTKRVGRVRLRQCTLHSRDGLTRSDARTPHGVERADRRGPGNSHLHWHVAPLQPGVPYERQQYHALMGENGVLDVDDDTQAAMARAIRNRL
jgi:hypothetical protein